MFECLTSQGRALAAGEFVTFYAKSYTAEALADSVSDNIVKWKAEHANDYHPGKEVIKKAPEKKPASLGK